MLHLNFNPFPVLTTSRLQLRQLKHSDKEELYFLRSDEKANEFLDRPKATSMDDVIKFIDTINTAISKNEAIYWAITEKNNDKLIGTICYWNMLPDESRGEIGYELNSAYQGKGYMQEAFSKIISYGLNTICFQLIEACTHKNNIRSIHLLEKNNFKRDLLEEKKHTELIDTVIYTFNNYR